LPSLHQHQPIASLRVRHRARNVKRHTSWILSHRAATDTVAPARTVARAPSDRTCWKVLHTLVYCPDGTLVREPRRRTRSGGWREP
jgi:hypothetical protein